MPSRYRTLTRIAWAAYALSMFLPVLHEMVDAGWKAFLLAIVLPFKPDQPFWTRGLCIAGVLANVAVVLTPWKFRGPAIHPSTPNGGVPPDAIHQDTQHGSIPHGAQTPREAQTLPKAQTPPGTQIPPRWLVIFLAASFIVNIGWFPLMSDAELDVGYYVWIGSIGTLAVVAFLNHRRTEPS